MGDAMPKIRDIGRVLSIRRTNQGMLYRVSLAGSSTPYTFRSSFDAAHSFRELVQALSADDAPFGFDISDTFLYGAAYVVCAGGPWAVEPQIRKRRDFVIDNVEIVLLHSSAGTGGFVYPDALLSKPEIQNSYREMASAIDEVKEEIQKEISTYSPTPDVFEQIRCYVDVLITGVAVFDGADALNKIMYGHNRARFFKGADEFILAIEQSTDVVRDTFFSNLWFFLDRGLQADAILPLKELLKESMLKFI